MHPVGQVKSERQKTTLTHIYLTMLYQFEHIKIRITLKKIGFSWFLEGFEI